jgi:hypothetical protein
MSRYSYRVEKLLRETKSPSLDILLEEEGDDKEETPAADEPESGSDDEGIPADAFAEDEPEEGESEEGGEEGEESDSGDDSLASDVNKLKKYIAGSKKAGDNISKKSHKYSGIANDFFKSIDRLVDKAGEEQISRAFESKMYSNQSIRGFLFEAEEDNPDTNIADTIEDLQNSLDSRENQLPDALDLARISYQYFERFDKVDRAIHIIKLVSKYFKKFINPDKDKVFDEFIDAFLDILQENGISIELDRSQAVKYKTAVGARTAG